MQSTFANAVAAEQLIN
jgi:hypothetical protein